MKRNKSAKKPNHEALAIADAGGRDVKGSRGDRIIPDAEELARMASAQQLKWLTETFGTEDSALQSRLLCEGVNAVSDFAGREMESFDHVAAAIRGIRPHDSLEGMLATQMVAVHTMAMTLMGRAALVNQSDLGVEVNLNRATKLMRTFTLQVETLGRYRGKGEQKMTVEHVHVYQGGQAIVGQMVAKDNKRLGKRNK
jgi:hypothetical protein